MVITQYYDTSLINDKKVKNIGQNVFFVANGILLVTAR